MKLEIIHHEALSDTQKQVTPLLFVHGAWHGAWCWDAYFLPYFAAQGYDSYALSLRGHGGSDNDKRLILTGVDDYVADVAQVAAQIEQETGVRPAVIGHSMGGFVVQHYLERHQAPGGVLVASIPYFGVIPFFTRATLKNPLVAMQCVLTLNLYPMVGTPQRARDHFFSPDVPQVDVLRYFALLGNESWRVGIETMFLKLPHPDRVKTPLLVVGAANDKIFAVNEVNATARAYGTVAKIFDNTAHDMMLETRWQAVADHILEWLDGQKL